jgi:hypothetical protein
VVGAVVGTVVGAAVGTVVGAAVVAGGSALKQGKPTTHRTGQGGRREIPSVRRWQGCTGKKKEEAAAAVVGRREEAVSLLFRGPC